MNGRDTAVKKPANNIQLYDDQSDLANQPERILPRIIAVYDPTRYPVIFLKSKPKSCTNISW